MLSDSPPNMPDLTVMLGDLQTDMRDPLFSGYYARIHNIFVRYIAQHVARVGGHAWLRLMHQELTHVIPAPKLGSTACLGVQLELPSVALGKGVPKEDHEGVRRGLAGVANILRAIQDHLRHQWLSAHHSAVNEMAALRFHNIVALCSCLQLNTSEHTSEHSSDVNDVHTLGSMSAASTAADNSNARPTPKARGRVGISEAPAGKCGGSVCVSATASSD